MLYLLYTSLSEEKILILELTSASFFSYSTSQHDHILVTTLRVSDQFGSREIVYGSFTVTSAQGEIIRKQNTACMQCCKNVQC